MRLLDLSAQAPCIHPTEQDKDGNPVEGATVFYARCLTGSEQGAINDALLDFGNMGVKTEGENAKFDMNMAISPSTRKLNRVRLGICNWDNLHDADGKLIEFTQETIRLGNREFQAIPMAVVDALPRDILDWLAEEVAKASTVSAQEGNV